jgi:CelD/BcsL family acetyltransferase involved in cellulose biosynthesis
MTVYTLDPLRDPRWSDLVQRHPLASVFHTTAWLEALRQTYGYRPMAFTTSSPGAMLEDGVVFCQVRSWLTGSRLVSLPFSDHCEPLADGAAVEAISAHLERLRIGGPWNYIEVRPHSDRFDHVRGISQSERFWFHCLDLRPPESTLLKACHKDSTQRKIQRAQREGVEYTEGRGEQLLRDFYVLLAATRHRHQLPPQPLAWFHNLGRSLGDSLKIRVAHHGGHAIAAIVTLRHRNTMVFKYGASDAARHALGGMHLLLWKTIQDARSAGCTMLDLGRCDMDNQGLATFKDRWGATRSTITYSRYTANEAANATARKYVMTCIKQVLGHAPDFCRVAAGRFLYRHAG